MLLIKSWKIIKTWILFLKFLIIKCNFIKIILIGNIKFWYQEKFLKKFILENILLKIWKQNIILFLFIYLWVNLKNIKYFQKIRKF